MIVHLWGASSDTVVLVPGCLRTQIKTAFAFTALETRQTNSIGPLAGLISMVAHHSAAHGVQHFRRKFAKIGALLFHSVDLLSA
jgi:hypothetical protein